MSRPYSSESSFGAERRQRLIEYLSKVSKTPFQWGVHDCAHFALGAVYAQTGQWHDPPYYTNAREAFECFCRQSISEWFDERFPRCDCVPPVGSIVVSPSDDAIIERAGVVVSDKAAFVCSAGLVFDRLSPGVDKYWRLP